MRLDRRLGDIEVVGDLLVEAAGAEHLQHAELLRGQLAQALADLALFAAGRWHVVCLRRGPGFAIEDGAQRMADRVRIGGFGDEAERTVVERAAHHGRFLTRGDHHHRQLRVQGTHVDQRIEALRTGHVEVHQDQVGVGVLVGQLVQRFHAVRFVQLHAGDDTAHGAAKGFAEQRVVIGNQEGRHGGGHVAKGVTR